MVTSSSIKISNPGGLVEEVQHRVEQGSIESDQFAAAAEGSKATVTLYWPDLFYVQWRDG